MNHQKTTKIAAFAQIRLDKIIPLLFLLASVCAFSAVAVGQQSVKLFPSVIRVQKGKSKTITAVAYNGPGQPDYNAAFTNFSPSNPSIATAGLVSVTGDDISVPMPSPPNLRTIVGVSAGVTNITATWNGITSVAAAIIVDDPSTSPTSIIHGDNDAFGGTSISTKVGEPIELNAESSSGVNKVEWVWGDGDRTTDLLSATHAYLLPGTYPVTLKVSNSGGVTATSTVNVHVLPHSTPTQVINVSTMTELLIAYNNAVGGEHIVIPAGTVLTGELELPAKNFTDYVTIRSSAVMPDIRNRIDPSNPGLVTLRGSYMNATPLIIKKGASKIRLIGLKFDPKHAPGDVYGPTYYLAQIGEAFTQTDVSQNPSKIILEHCVVNPPDDVNVVHAVLNDGYKVSIISSWLGNIKTFGGQDSQAVVSFDGRGAHVYHNTFFEASTENVMYGGVVPSIEGLTSTNIEFRRSHFSKRLSWRVYSNEYHLVNVKNLFETKNARRIYFEGSILENHWDSYRNQRFALVFKSGTSPGMPGEFVPWAVSEDIVFENNKVNHTLGGITTSVDTYWIGSFHGLLPNNIVVRNTLFDDLSGYWGAPGIEWIGRRFIQPNSVIDLKVDHATVASRGEDAGASIYFVTNNNLRFSVKNTLFPRNEYGIHGSGVGVGAKSLNPGTGGTGEPTCARASDATWNFEGNVMPFSTTYVFCMPSAGTYNNSYPSSVSDIGFVDSANGDFRLSNSSPYKATATDGSDPGVNMDLLTARTACSVSGMSAPCILSGTTAADASVGGRIVTTQGRGISTLRVTVSGGNLAQPVAALTSSFGYYRIDGLQAGQTYVVTVAGSKRYRFETQSRLVSLGEDAFDIDFVGSPR